MTLTPVAQTNSKTAEFARLFDLFDRVATRRVRTLTGDTGEVIFADDIANVPAEFAPLLKNLSMILSSRARRDEEHDRHARPVSTTKSRHNTLTKAPSTTPTAKGSTPRVDVMESSDEVREGEPENPSFPLGECYPFTFKLMLHKLYDLDEWAEKVKNAVETSKSQFKPLGERFQNVVRDATSSNKEKAEKKSSVRPVLGASTKFKPPNMRHLHSVAMSRDATAGTKEREEKRSNTRPALGTSAKFKPPSTRRQPHSVGTPWKVETSRVLKKRCIGRRKSINGPLSTGVWVYDAAISATEVAGSRPAVEITLFTPRHADGVVEHRARHRSLTALEEISTRVNARRKVKVTVPLLQEKATESAPLQPLSVLSTESAQESMETKSVVKRGSVASIFASERCNRVSVKRPLYV